MPRLDRMVLARLIVGGVIALSVPLLQTSFGLVDSPVLAQAAPTAVPCVVANRGIHIELQNPSAGDTLQPGTPVVMSGIAYDPASTSGPGHCVGDRLPWRS